MYGKQDKAIYLKGPMRHYVEDYFTCGYGNSIISSLFAEANEFFTHSDGEAGLPCRHTGPRRIGLEHGPRARVTGSCFNAINSMVIAAHIDIASADHGR